MIISGDPMLAIDGDHLECFDSNKHQPILDKSDQIERLEQRNSDSELSANDINVIVEYMKERIAEERPHCPTCNTFIDKQDACNLMICEAVINGQTCGTSYCFVCSKKFIIDSADYHKMRQQSPHQVPVLLDGSLNERENDSVTHRYGNMDHHKK
jgi:hypothetical protein